MIRTIKRNDVTITFEETEELKQQVYDQVLNFFLEVDAFCGETIMQSDTPQIEAPVFLSDIADDIFKFDVEYDD